MNIGNALGNVGAAFQGQRDYADYIQAKQQKQQEIDFNKLRMEAYQQQMAQQQVEQKRQQDIARGYVGQFGDPIPPRPEAPQPPAPGQASVPMMQYGQRPMGPQAPSMGMPPGPMQQGMPPQGPQGGPPQGPPPIPPYRSMNQPPQQQQPPSIPAPPQYDFDSMVKKIQATGVTDEQAIMTIMEKNVARLDAEGKNRLAFLKEQEMHQDRQMRMDETRTHNRNMEDIGRTNADTRRKSGADAAAPTSADSLDAAAWDYIIKGHPPPARGGMYQKVMGRVAEIAKENGMSSKELITASADTKTKLAAKKNFEVRAQNMARAENVLSREIPVLEDAVRKMNLYKLPGAAKAQIEVLRRAGDPNVTAMDRAAEVVFNEFEQIATGNPGALNVQDVVNARHAYSESQTPQQMEATITNMKRVIKNAKAAMDDTRKEIMDDINKSTSGKQGGPKAGTVQDGYKFKGGDPAKQENWERV